MQDFCKYKPANSVTEIDKTHNEIQDIQGLYAMHVFFSNISYRVFIFIWEKNYNFNSCPNVNNIMYKSFRQMSILPTIWKSF